MFTGIVEQTAAVLELRGSRSDGARLDVRLERPDDGLAIGGSVAVNGCCLTATGIEGGTIAFDLHPETLARTRFDERLVAGVRVNIERPILATGRLDGHFVQGHVDGVGRVVGARFAEGGAELDIEVPAGLQRYVVEKGSLAVDGVSLTCARVDGRRVTIAVVPHTLRVTNLCDARVGSLVSVEVDILAKYVERLASPTR